MRFSMVARRYILFAVMISGDMMMSTPSTPSDDVWIRKSGLLIDDMVRMFGSNLLAIIQMKRLESSLWSVEIIMSA